MASKWIQTFKFAYYGLCRRKLKKVRAGRSPESLVDFIFHDCWQLLRPGQMPQEILGLASMLSEIKPKYLLEIGTGRSGGTLFLFSRLATENATLVSVDLPGGAYGESYPKRKVPFFKSFALAAQTVLPLRADSHSPETLTKVKEIFKGKQLDFLFIDGDHTYEGVKEDFEIYSPLVRKGGLIAFHDIVVHPPEARCEVNRFWNELKPGYEHWEFVEDWEQKRFGIGLIKKI